MLILPLEFVVEDQAYVLNNLYSQWRVSWVVAGFHIPSERAISGGCTGAYSFSCEF